MSEHVLNASCWCRPDFEQVPPTDFGQQVATRGGLPRDWDLRLGTETELVVEEEGLFRVLAFGAALLAFFLLGYVGAGLT